MLEIEKTKNKDSLKPMLQSDVAKMKLVFKANVEKQLTKVIKDKMSESHINALRKYITIQMLNREKLTVKELAKIAKLSEIKIRKITQDDADSPFDYLQRKEIKAAAKQRYKTHGHGLLGTGQRRLYFSLISTGDKSVTENSIEIYLNQKGYFIRDYVRGYATDMQGKQEYKIGKLIKSNAELSKAFMADSSRIADNQCLVLSDYANDVAYMSTRRGWQSCMSSNGMFKEQTPSDVEHGTMIGYLVNKKDPYIYDPLARVLLKALYNAKGEVSYHVNKCYGLHHDAFKKTAEQIAEQISSNENGIFKLPKKVYSDNTPSQKFIMSEDVKTEEFLEMTNVSYTKSTSGEFIVDGDLDISGLGLKKLPDLTNVKVMGNFNCSYNVLDNLIGVPQYVGGDFDCGSSQLRSLKGAPTKVMGNFSCGSNELTSLKGAPKEIRGCFTLSYNNLTTLEYMPEKIGGSIYCQSNKLTSLEGAPQIVKGDFYCGYNQLTSLVGAPQDVRADFSCNSNKLTTLEGAPRKVTGVFLCNDNELMTLLGAPLEVGSGFDCSYNQLKNLIGSPLKVRGVFQCSQNQLISLEGSPEKVSTSFYCNNNQLINLIGAPKEVGGSFNCSFNDLITVQGLPKKFASFSSEFGMYYSHDDVPKRYFKESMGRNFIQKAKQTFSKLGM